MFLEYEELERCRPDLPVYNLIVPYKFFERLETEAFEDILLSVKTTAGEARATQLFPRVVVSPEAWLQVMILDTKKTCEESQKLWEKLLTLDKKD